MESYQQPIGEDTEFNEDVKKQFAEWHKFVFYIFFSKYSNLNSKTRKAYIKAIWDFMKFSPNLEPEDFEPFINSRFNLANQSSEFKTPYSGTPAKYAITIKRFLSSIYTVDDLTLYINHYKKKSPFKKISS